MASANRYDDQNIATMEMIYGEGYLSAGGDTEVAAILEGIHLAGTRVLDLGCGLGGASITIARDHGANHVHAVDIDGKVLERAAQLVAMAGLEERISLQRIDPGPLPFADNSFDVAYITAVSCHLESLQPFFGEVARVLRPGGTIAGCEWLKLEDNAAFRDWDGLLRDRGLNFYFVDREIFADALEESGFEQVRVTDRTQTIASLSRKAVERVNGELRDDLTNLLGEGGFQVCREWTITRSDAYSAGGIGQGHFRGVVPEN